MGKNNVVSAAMGELPFDLVIQNVNYVNGYTKEIYQADIGIKEQKIAHITQPGEERLRCQNVYDGTGKYAIPGLVDAHTHIECSMMTPANMARAIMPHGVTTIVCDPHEMGNVKGLEGVRYILEASEGLPLNVLIAAPSCIPSVEKLETAGAEFWGDEIEEILSMDRVVALAEVMDYYGVIHQSDRMNQVLEAAKKKKVLLQGHAPMLTGRELSAYIAAGVMSCHETSFAQEARCKLRAGMILECRRSSNLNDIEKLVPVLREFGYPTNAVFCTDDRSPADLLNEGALDYVVKQAIRLGVPPIEAVRMATYHPALAFHLKECGVLRPGSKADIVLLDDLEDFTVNEVFAGGVLVAKDGKMTVDIKEPHPAIEEENTVCLKHRPEREDLEIKVNHEETQAAVNVICFKEDNPTVTQCETIELPVEDGRIQISGKPELSMMAVYERHGKNGNHAMAYVKNFGLKKGAVATTFSHDCHNLMLLGKSKDDMLLAAQVLEACHGGIVCVSDGKVDTLVELPIGGIVSQKGVEALAEEFDNLNRVMREYGVPGECPYIQISCLNLPVCPQIRLTDKGLVDVDSQKIIHLLA